MNTREQQRAQAAFQRVSAAAAERWKDDYGRQCLRLPTLLHECGLCQTIAFLQAKGAHHLLNDLAYISGIAASAEAFAGKVRTAPVSDYQWMSHEAMACAQWLKRYTQAVLDIDPSETEGPR